MADEIFEEDEEREDQPLRAERVETDEAETDASDAETVGPVEASDSTPSTAPPSTAPPSTAPPSVAPDRRRWPRRHPVLAGLLAALGLLLLILAYEAITWPDVAALVENNPESTAFIERYKAQQRASGQSDDVRWRWVPYSRISPHLKRAVLVSEDINFFSHDGFDTGEMKKALEKAWEAKEIPRGASTLTQQLAKNLWLSPSKNPLRKVKEALLTRQLEAHLSKRRILELYLNVVELGPGIYGAEAGARHWFGVSAASLTERQAAQLAASLPRPRTWHPGVSSRGYANRVESALRRMGKATWLWKEI